MAPIVLSVFFTLVASHVPLSGTSRLPGAKGIATVEPAQDTVHIVLRLDGMKPAPLFGGDFNTYVLWLVPPGGRPINAGEVTLSGNSGGLETSTTLKDFSLFVTAEPHYAVTLPSRFVVLKMAEETGVPEYEPGNKGVVYNYERDSLAHAKEASGPVRSVIRQAYTAVRLAERAGAYILATNELREARRSLELTIQLSKQGKPFEAVESQARKTVELAAIAQQRAEGKTIGGRK